MQMEKPVNDKKELSVNPEPTNWIRKIVKVLLHILVMLLFMLPSVSYVIR